MSVLASPQSLSKTEGLYIGKFIPVCIEVLSFGEDLGEA